MADFWKPGSCAGRSLKKDRGCAGLDRRVGWVEGGGGVADDVAVITRSHHSGQQEAWR